MIKKPKEIKIPFNDWSKKRLLEGIKTATSRNKKYGDVGDFFKVDRQVFELDFIIKVPLGFIADNLSVTEGAINKSEFIKVWRDIHPRKGWVSSQRVWYHHFFNKKNRVD